MHSAAVEPGRGDACLACKAHPPSVQWCTHIAPCRAVLQAHDSANVEAGVEAWQEERPVSKYAEGLEQLQPTRTIPMDPKQVPWALVCPGTGWD